MSREGPPPEALGPSVERVDDGRMPHREGMRWVPPLVEVRHKRDGTTERILLLEGYYRVLEPFERKGWRP